MSGKNKLFKIKIILDIIMVFVLVLLYNKRVISMSFHEIGGLCIFGLFIIHNVLNGKWIINMTKKLFKSGTGAKAKIQWIVNLLLFISFTAIIVTGLMIAKTLPFRINGFNGAQKWHYFAAALSIILMGIHLGLHWNLFHGLFKKYMPQKVFVVIGYILLVVTLVFGCYSLATGSFVRWISSPFSASNEKEFSKNGFMPTTENSDGKNFDWSNIPQDGNFDSSNIPEGFDASNMPEGFDASNTPGGFKGDMGGKSGFSVLTLFSTIATYISEMIVFAFIVAIIEILISKISSEDDDEEDKEDDDEEDEEEEDDE